VRLCPEELERRLVPAAILSTSTNWSGYAVTTAAGAVTDVAGKWVVPAVTGSGTAYSSAWVGIDGFNSSTVEQIGTDSDVVNGVPQYYAWFEMYPSGSVNLPLTLHAGDTMSADVSYASGKFTLSITDVTTGKSFTTTQSAPSARRSSAEWVMEAPSSFSGVLPLANFGTATFSGGHATINGATGAIDASRSGTQLNEINMVSRFGATEDTTSGLTDSGSPATSGFTVTFASTGTTPAPRPHHHWWWFEPDQGTSTGAMTAATAAASLNVVGPGALALTPQAAALVAAASASQPAVTPSAAVSLARAATSAPAAVTVAGHGGNTGDSCGPADAATAPELLPAPSEAGARPARQGAAPAPGADSDSAPRAAADFGRACDIYFMEAVPERTTTTERPAAPIDVATGGTAAAEATAGLFLALALGGFWRRPNEGTGARRRRLRWFSAART
jgi:hypothetical protein